MPLFPAPPRPPPVPPPLPPPIPLPVPPAPPSLVKDQQIVKYQQAVQVGVFDCILMECDRMNGCEAYKKV